MVEIGLIWVSESIVASLIYGSLTLALPGRNERHSSHFDIIGKYVYVSHEIDVFLACINEKILLPS